MLGELNGIVNPTLRKRIDKPIVGKLIKVKVNFGLGHPVNKNSKIYYWVCWGTLQTSH